MTDDAARYDEQRTAYLQGLNIRVLRFLNTDVYENIEAVCAKILDELTPGPS